MTNPIKPKIFPAIMIVAAFVLSFYFYLHFPERIASHWNFKGEVDGWMGRGFGAFFFPVLLLGLYLLFLFLPLLDPKKERYEEFKKVYHIFIDLILAVLFAVYVITGLYNLGFAIRVSLVVPLIIGLMMIVLGNYLGKIRPNWFMGIRTPWTLSSETVWNKTHRVGGWFFIVFGLLLIAAPWLSETGAMIALIGGAALAVVGTMVYSYVAYRGEKK